MESFVWLPVDSAPDEWAGWLWCCSRSHACCPCVCVCMCELMQSEIVRNTGITGRSNLSDEMDARLLLRRSNHTHIYSPRGGRAGVSRRQSFTYDAQTLMCLDVNAHAQNITDVWVQARMPTHTNLSHAVSSSNCTHPTGLRSNQQD